jgi:predicted TIM-barrel fold metal-dependent hydrolase
VRVLGDAEPKADTERSFQKFGGGRFPTEGGLWDGNIRIKDMDDEGVDAQLIVPQGYEHEDPEVAMALLRAEHHFLDDFSSVGPERLKSLIMVSPLNVEASVAEIKRWGDKPWAVGVRPVLPLDYPVDHPDMEPIWKAADEANLCIVHHSFATGYPGYRDLWGSPFLGRLSSHPWGAMRFLAAFLGAGILDRYPNIRVAVLESGFGWLPFWARRMDEQVTYVGYVKEGLKQKPSEYMMGGRFFCSIVLHEGPDMVDMVNQMMGDHILMYGSDYPHAESHFPNTVDEVSQWKSLSGDKLRKFMWDNPVRAFGEP